MIDPGEIAGRRGRLAGIAEVAEIAGVSKQRASQLAASAGFPAPFDRIAAGPVWRRQDIEAWAAKRQAERAKSAKPEQPSAGG